MKKQMENNSNKEKNCKDCIHYVKENQIHCNTKCDFNKASFLPKDKK